MVRRDLRQQHLDWIHTRRWFNLQAEARLAMTAVQQLADCRYPVVSFLALIASRANSATAAGVGHLLHILSRMSHSSAMA
jgi:hypothetical protein